MKKTHFDITVKGPYVYTHVSYCGRSEYRPERNPPRMKLSKRWRKVDCWDCIHRARKDGKLA